MAEFTLISGRRETDLSLRLMEVGLGAVIIFAPMPFGAVVPSGRLALEIFSLALLLVWIERLRRYPGYFLSRSTCLGLAGLILVALLQILPVGDTVVSFLSPATHDLHLSSAPPDDIAAIEAGMLGSDPTESDPATTLSVSPARSASALRTGTALVALMIVGCTVAAGRGIKGIGLAAVISAGFQGCYGTLVVASGNEVIWHIPKKYNLGCATGTFVNRNHFADFLAMTIPLGLAITIMAIRRLTEQYPEHGMADWFGRRGIATILSGVLVTVSLTGLLLSYSRAGIALGVLAVLWTILASGGRRVGLRFLVVAVLLLIALVPLVQLGADHLLERYAGTSESLSSPTGRKTVWSDTVTMIGSFPLLGAGFGTFGTIYPFFRSPQIRMLFDHAHNDPLQFLAEGGLVGGFFLMLILVPLGRRLLHALGGSKGAAGVAVGAGVTVFMLHALVDFNFHIPSNAAVFAILAGSLEGLWYSHRN